MLPDKISFVDLETSGPSSNHDRIIEIGIVRVENHRVVQKYQSLVNPGVEVPEFIEDMTGISSRDLQTAPTFRQIQDQVQELLKDSVVVAHNVRFDYGFLRQEFRRFNITFSAPHFCTVKLFRSLYPQLSRHNLDALITHFDLKCKHRHRAFDDAFVLWQFYRQLVKTESKTKLVKFVNQALKKPSLPLGVSLATLEKLPETPGVYAFYDNRGQALYVGKATNIKDQVLSHFANDYHLATDIKISQQIRDVEPISTETELEAILLEAKIIKKLQPIYNKKLRSLKGAVSVILETDSLGFLVPRIQPLSEISVQDSPHIMGTFGSAKQAEVFLQGPCLKQKDESALKYNLRVITAFTNYKIRPWPFKGRVVIHNKLLVDKWCILDEDESYSFDMETYRILRTFVNNPRNQKYIRNV